MERTKRIIDDVVWFAVCLTIYAGMPLALWWLMRWWGA